MGSVSDTTLNRFAHQPRCAEPAKPTSSTASQTFGACGARNTGTTASAQISSETFRAAFKLQPEHFDVGWPDEEREAAQAAEHRIEQALRYGGNWTGLGWTLGSDAWLARTWATHGARVVQRLAGASDRKSVV